MQHIFAAYLNNTFETDGRITACYRTSKAIVFSLSLFHTQTHIQQSLKAHSDNNCFGLLSMPKSLQHAEVNKATADFLTCSFFCVCMSLLTSACNNDVCWTAVEMLAVHFYAQWLETYPSTVVQDVCVRWWWEGVEYVNALYAVLLFVVATNPPSPHALTCRKKLYDVCGCWCVAVWLVFVWAETFLFALLIVQGVWCSN